MEKKKIVLVACGAGIATSTVVTEKVEKLLKENKINALVVQCKIGEVSQREGEADLLVTTTITPKQYSFPVVKGMGYLTGINTQKIDAEIVNYLKAE